LRRVPKRALHHPRALLNEGARLSSPHLAGRLMHSVGLAEFFPVVLHVRKMRAKLAPARGGSYLNV